MIERLFDGTRETGSHKLGWNTAGLNPGIYFCELDTPAGRRVARAVVAR